MIFTCLRMTAMMTADVDDVDRVEGAMRGIQSLAWSVNTVVVSEPVGVADRGRRDHFRGGCFLRRDSPFKAMRWL
jgi:hypothetical protein